MIIAIHGLTRAGKSSIAEYLERAYGFSRASLGALMYEEVSEAFWVPIENLKSAEWKDADRPELAIANCKNMRFVDWVLRKGFVSNTDIAAPQKPRRILQLWAQDFRRAIDPNYFMLNLYRNTLYGRMDTNWVIDDLRDPNDARFLHYLKHTKCIDNLSIIWVKRATVKHTGHASDDPFARAYFALELDNDGELSELYNAVDNFMEINKWNLLKRA